VNYTQPINQATGGPKAIPTPGDNPTEIQSCCQEPYYEAKPSGESLSAEDSAPTCLTPLPPLRDLRPLSAPTSQL